MLAGDQVWWKLSPIPSAPPPNPVPHIALGEEHVQEAAAWLQQGFSAAQPAHTKKVSDPVRAGVHWHPRAQQSREIYASTSMAHTSDLRSCEPSVVGRKRYRNPFTSSRLCPGCSFGFYLGCSSSVLNWQCVCVEQQSCLPHLLWRWCASTNISEPFQWTR